MEAFLDPKLLPYVVGFFATLIGGFLGFLRLRQLTYDAAQGRLNTVNKELIAALETQVRFVEGKVTDVEKRYDQCIADNASLRAENRLLKFNSERIG